MGLCGSSTGDSKEKAQAERERRLNKLIQTDQDQTKVRDETILKLLLLGTGESGKSTLFKQVRAPASHCVRVLTARAFADHSAVRERVLG